MQVRHQLEACAQQSAALASSPHRLGCGVPGKGWGGCLGVADSASWGPSLPFGQGVLGLKPAWDLESGRGGVTTSHWGLWSRILEFSSLAACPAPGTLCSANHNLRRLRPWPGSSPTAHESCIHLPAGRHPPTPASSATASPKGPYTSRRPSSPSSASAFFHHRWVCVPDLRKGAVNKDTLLGPEASLVTT